MQPMTCSACALPFTNDLPPVVVGDALVCPPCAELQRSYLLPDDEQPGPWVTVWDTNHSTELAAVIVGGTDLSELDARVYFDDGTSEKIKLNCQPGDIPYNPSYALAFGSYASVYAHCVVCDVGYIDGVLAYKHELLLPDALKFARSELDVIYMELLFDTEAAAIHALLYIEAARGPKPHPPQHVDWLNKWAVILWDERGQ